MEIKAIIMGMTMDCVSCGFTIEEGKIEGTAIDQEDITEDEYVVAKDSPCPKCGGNVYNSIVGYIDFQFLK